MLEKWVLFFIAISIMAVFGLIYYVLETFQHWFVEKWDAYARAKYNREKNWQRIVAKEQKRIKSIKD